MDPCRECQEVVVVVVFFFVAQVASKHGHVDVVRFLLNAHGDQNKAWSQENPVWCRTSIMEI